MISFYQVKPRFQQLLRPILATLYKIKVTANMITWAGILLSFVMGVLMWLYPFESSLLALPVVLLVRMALNALDGMMARTYNMQSKGGEVLNELGDVISDLCLFFPLLKLFSLDLYVLLAFLFLSVINEYAGIMGKAISGTRRYEGPMGKSDRAFFIGLVSLILFFNKGVSEYVNFIFILFSFLLLISTVVRIKKTIKPI